MVENSIDAGATNITVEIKNGGISFIRITDNGKGIAKDDIELAFERHATSKIRSANDLSTVKSMGFRGEALASIGSIANVELTSKTENDEIGSRIVVEGGEVLSLDEIGCSKGTTITVRNLFFNTPVRYKFLKKDFTESGYIEDVITRIALVHPEIAIKFINTGKIVIQTNGNGDIKSVIYSIFGKEVAANIMPVNYDYEDITIKGVIGKAQIARSNRSNQIFFVNKRYVKDKTLTSAVDQAYKGILPMGKFGFLVLNIEMLPSKVDVNVHPAKLEVRFAEENIMFKAMYHAVKDTLEKVGTISDREIVQQIKTAEAESFKIKDAKENMEKTYTIKQENEIPKAMQEEKAFKETPVLEMDAIKANTNVFENLKKLQEELRKEVEQNPNLQLTDKYKQMEEQYNKILKPVSEKNTAEKIIPIVFKDEEEEKNKERESTGDTINDEQEEAIETKNEWHVVPSETMIDGQVAQGDIRNDGQDAQNDTRYESQETPINIKNELQAAPSDTKIEEQQILDDKKIEEQAVLDNIQNKNIEEISTEAKLKMANGKIENIEYDFELPISKNSKTESVEVAKISEEKNKDKDKEDEEENLEEKTKMPSFEEMYRQLFGKEPYGGRKQEEAKKQEETPKEENFYTVDTKMEDSNISMFEDDESYKKLQYKFIGTAFNAYLIIQLEDELYIIDEHLAHEKIMYEKIKRNFYADGDKASQLLLLPDIITLTQKEMDIAKDNFELFEKAGFILEEFGENTIKLSGVPDVCVNLDTANLFKQTLDVIDTVARNAITEKEEKFLLAIAGKAAIKTATNLKPEEIDSLLDELFSMPNPLISPDGKAIAIKMTKYEIERKFARK